MRIPREIHRSLTDTPPWRHTVLAALVLGSLLWMLSLEPISQNPGYHGFADTRRFAGIPNGFDVLSNLPFLIIGILGVRFCLRKPPPLALGAWIVLFTGVGLVSAGSAYYHWSPTNETLVWDRLPMTLGFMGLFVALLGEYVGDRLAVILLVPAVVIGFLSVLYWHFFDDLRFYLWVQLVPLLTIPAVMVLYRSWYTHQWFLIVALSFYVLAKVAEFHDLAVFRYTGELVSGHSIKHLLAAAGCYGILMMLQQRSPGNAKPGRHRGSITARRKRGKEEANRHSVHFGPSSVTRGRAWYPGRDSILGSREGNV